LLQMVRAPYLRSSQQQTFITHKCQSQIVPRLPQP
jgi:hypothetical protein